jgi:hypothetical protein
VLSSKCMACLFPNVEDQAVNPELRECDRECDRERDTSSGYETIHLRSPWSLLNSAMYSRYTVHDEKKKAKRVVSQASRRRSTPEKKRFIVE